MNVEILERVMLGENYFHNLSCNLLWWQNMMGAISLIAIKFILFRTKIFILISLPVCITPYTILPIWSHYAKFLSVSWFQLEFEQSFISFFLTNFFSLLNSSTTCFIFLLFFINNVFP